jgi:uncharacterized protein (TIGR02996 family)
MPTYQHGDRYWEISLAGRKVTTRTAKQAIGITGRASRGSGFQFSADGPARSKTHPSREAARQAYLDAIDEKKTDGWKLIAGNEEVSVATELHRDAALEAALVAKPDDDQALMVYADWLLGRNDPRGELISLQREMRGVQDRVRFMELKKEEAVLHARHDAAWLGKLVADHLGQGQVRLAWSRGFVDVAVIQEGKGNHAELVAELLASPVALLLRKLEAIGPDVADVIVRARPRCLEHVYLRKARAKVDEERLRSVLVGARILKL